MKKISTLAMAFAASLGISAAAQCYVIGEVYNAAGEKQAWGFDTGIEMTEKGDGVYEWTGTIYGYFGFAEALGTDWDDLNNNYRLYPADGVQQITLVDNKAVIDLSTVKAGGDSWTLGAETEATCTVDLNNSTLTVTTAGAIVIDDTPYLMGNNGVWAAGDDNKFTADGDSWVLKGVSLGVNPEAPEEGISLKIASSNWSTVNMGASYVDELPIAAEIGKPYTTVQGSQGNIVVEGVEEGVLYDVTFTNNGDETGTLLITKANEGAIDAIEFDANAPVEYYTIQGVKVAGELNAGIYIAKQGDKVSKILVK